MGRMVTIDEAAEVAEDWYGGVVTDADHADLVAELDKAARDVGTRAQRVYVSGAITGTTDYMERFANAEAHLQALGFNVVNPAKENHSFPAGTPWTTYMRASVKLLADCDAIYMLDGWRGSRGAQLEHSVADSLGMVILHDGGD